MAEKVCRCRALLGLNEKGIKANHKRLVSL